MPISVLSVRGDRTDLQNSEFYEIGEYKHTTRAHQLLYSYTIFSFFVRSSMADPYFKFVGIYTEEGVPKLRGLTSGCVFPKLISAACRRNYVLDPNKLATCKNCSDLLYYHAEYGGTQTAHAVGSQVFNIFVCFLLLILSNCSSDTTVQIWSNLGILAPHGATVYLHTFIPMGWE